MEISSPLPYDNGERKYCDDNGSCAMIIIFTSYPLSDLDLCTVEGNRNTMQFLSNYLNPVLEIVYSSSSNGSLSWIYEQLHNGQPVN